MELYISPQGDDKNPGTREAPKKSFQHIQEGIRQAREAGFVESQVTVWLLGGVYQLEETLLFDSRDSGEKGKPLVFRGVEGQKARLTTGSQLPVAQFRSASQTSIGNRLSDKAKFETKVIKITDQEHQRELNKVNGLLLWNGHLLEKCRWPNRGYGHMSKIFDRGPWTRTGQTPPRYSKENPTGGSFRSMEKIDLEKLEECLSYGDTVQVEGYFHNDWFFERIPLGAAKDQKIQLLHHTLYGIVSENGVPRRFRLVNALSELDEPGEWYFDPKTNLLALWPVRSLSPQDVFSVSGRSAAIQVSGAEHIIFQNLVIEGTGEVGMRVQGGSHITVGACEFKSGSARGLQVNGGKNHLVTGCQFRGLASALSVKGGNRRTLEPCGHEVTNCEFSDLRNRGYGAVRLRGVGIRFANNLMHDINGALVYRGNDILIEKNEFYNMGWEMGDWNAIYTGADWAGAGNIVRYNFIHHLMEMPGAYPVGAVRNDDNGQGTRYHGNVFFKTGRYCVSFSGANNQLTGNVALETPELWYVIPGASNQAELDKKWAEIVKFESGELRRGDKGDYIWNAEQVYGKEGWKSGLWAERYPILKQVMEGRNGWAPTFCMVRDNYSDGSRINVHGGSLKDLPSTLEFKKTKKTSAKKVFDDAKKLIFQSKFSLRIDGKDEDLPFDEIGLYVDAFRKNAPDKETYRGEITRFYRKTPSYGGQYHPKEMRKRYPLPSYLRKE